MSMRTIASSSPKSASASVRASSVLPTPVGPSNRKLPYRPIGIRKPRPRTPDRFGYRFDGLLLSDHPLVELPLKLEQALSLLLGELAYRDAGLAAHHLRYVLRAHLDHGRLPSLGGPQPVRAHSWIRPLRSWAFLKSSAETA